MKRVVGLGGVFFKAEDRDRLMGWYRDHLGIDSDSFGFMFRWKENDAPHRTGYTVWGPFAEDTEYFDPSAKPYMVNYRVDDLNALIDALKQEGVQIVGSIEEHENGKFAWILDPEGNKVERWEPIDPEADPYSPPD
jgi:predicted enzyme related to lactoylglutathione lyase